MAGDARSAAPSDIQGDGRPGARECVPGRGLDPVAAVQALPEPSFRFRRVYAFGFSLVLAGIAIGCVCQSASPHVKWIGVAAIVALVAIAFLYMDAAKVTDVARIVQGGLMLRSGLGGGYGYPEAPPYTAPDDARPIGFALPTQGGRP